MILGVDTGKKNTRFFFPGNLASGYNQHYGKYMKIWPTQIDGVHGDLPSGK